MRKLIIGDIGARLPMVQGSLGVAISLPGLVSAVANEGGIGIISAADIGMSGPDYIRNYLEVTGSYAIQYSRMTRFSNWAYILKGYIK